MSKGKNKSKKNRSIYKAIKPYIPNSKVLYSILGVAGVGLAIGAAMGKDKRQALTGKITDSVKNLRKRPATSDTSNNLAGS